MSTADHSHPGSEAELRQTLLEYQAILDNASLGITFTRQRTFLHCNDRFGEMFGWASKELIGKPTSIVYPSPEAYAELSRIAIPILGNGKQLDTEILMMRRDGSKFWCRMLAKAIDPADHSKGSIFITEDISAHKEADEALKRLLLEYQAILDNASLGITFTRQRTFLHCNARFSEMFGWTNEELVGQPTHILYPSREAFAQLSRIAIPTLSSGRRLDTELLMMKRDGTLFWCRMLAKAIDASDHNKGSIFITEDITVRRAAQEALAKAHDELELRVLERTAELAETNARLKNEIHERRLAEEQVRHLANHDALTGLPNRRLLEDRLEHALTVAKRNSGQLAVNFIDLDHFKPINDTLGHRIGDLLLQEVARRLDGLLREADTVSRVGGDEFVLVLADMLSEQAACDTAQKILDALMQPYVVDGHDLHITPSIGISLYPRDGLDAETLIARADMAMYQAKQNGRKNYQIFSESVTRVAEAAAGVVGAS